MQASQALEVDQAREFVVNYQDKRSGELRLSMKVLEKAMMWQRLRQISEEAATIEGVVDAVRPGGLMVKVYNCLPGFVPGSHVNEVSSLHEY